MEKKILKNKINNLDMVIIKLESSIDYLLNADITGPITAIEHELVKLKDIKNDLETELKKLT